MAPVIQIPSFADKEKLTALLFVRLWADVLKRIKPSPPVTLVEKCMACVLEIHRLDTDLSSQFYKVIMERVIWPEFQHLIGFYDDQETALAVTKICQLLIEKNVFTKSEFIIDLHSKMMKLMSPDLPQWQKYETDADQLVVELNEVINQIIGFDLVKDDRPTYTTLAKSKQSLGKKDT